MKQAIWDFLYRFFPKHGHHLVPSRLLYDWQRNPVVASKRSSHQDQGDLYLRPENPRLDELRQRYAAFDRQVTTPLVWSPGYLSEEDVKGFRGAGAYVSQDCGPNYDRIAMGLTFYYLQSHDRLQLLAKLSEEPTFGISSFEIGGRLLSRDLLDSVVEINFLDRELGLSQLENFKVLDIGAGYGRLARRMVDTMPNLSRYLCTDAVPESAFLCEFYLKHCGADRKAAVVLLDEIEDTLAKTPIDVAVNIHSFSECDISAIDWWVRLLAKYQVPNLVIVPNQKFEGGRNLAVEDGREFLSIIEKHGYKRRKMVEKYDDPFLMSYGLDPGYFHVFRFAEV